MSDTFDRDDRIVTMAVKRAMRRMPSHITADDLHSAGWIGLLEARANFDESRGVKFATFASTRVDGAIRDHLRSLDWVPRSVRRRERQLAEAERALGENATPEAVAEAVGLDVAEATEGVHSVQSMDTPHADGVSLGDMIAAPVPSPGWTAETGELAEHCLGALSDTERTVVLRSVIEGDRLHEIGEALGVTEGRVSQIRSGALKKMRTRALAA